MKIPDACLSRDLTTDVSEGVCEGAIHWLFWLRSGGSTPADLEIFRRWRAQSDEHARVAYEVIWLWNALGLLTDPDYALCIRPSGSRYLRANNRNRKYGVRGSIKRVRRTAHALLKKSAG